MPTKTSFVSDTPAAQLVWHLMQERGLNQSQVGRLGGISRSTVNNILTGIIERPDLDTLLGMSVAFQVEPAYIFEQLGINLYEREEEWRELARRFATIGPEKLSKVLQVLELVQE